MIQKLSTVEVKMDKREIRKQERRRGKKKIKMMSRNGRKERKEKIETK